MDAGDLADRGGVDEDLAGDRAGAGGVDDCKVGEGEGGEGEGGHEKRKVWNLEDSQSDGVLDPSKPARAGEVVRKVDQFFPSRVCAQ